MFLSLVFNVYSFKDDPSLMYKFNTDLIKNYSDDKLNLSLTSDEIGKTRNCSTTSSVISSLPADSDAVLEDCFEMLAQLAPEALVSASLTKRYNIIIYKCHIYVVLFVEYITTYIITTGLNNALKKISNTFMMK